MPQYTTRSGSSDFARLFQAVRIAVNDEIGGLERALDTLRVRLIDPLRGLGIKKRKSRMQR